MAKHNHDYCILDIESGGTNPKLHGICSMACSFLTNDLAQSDNYEVFIKPYGLEYTEEAYGIHGITVEELNTKGIELKLVYQQLCALFKKHKNSYYKPILVGHNLSAFDAGSGLLYLEEGSNNYLGSFLCWLFEKFEDNLYNYVEHFTFDTLFYAKMALKGAESLPNLKLGTVCEAFGIEGSDSHDAENDVAINQKLFLFIMHYIQGNKDVILAQEKTEKARINFHI
jgi:DNA polymerase III epsilon subunit-like protein